MFLEAKKNYTSYNWKWKPYIDIHKILGDSLHLMVFNWNTFFFLSTFVH